MANQISGDDLFAISDKNTLITGGTAGIGLGIAQHFVEQGVRVVITGRRDNGDEIAAAVGATFVRMDVSDERSVSAAIEEAAGHYSGRIDTLILNAGMDLRTGSIETVDLAAYRRLFDVNLFGLVQCLRDASPHLPRGATVIATSSPAGLLPAAGMGAYGASKAALNHLTRVFAAELAGAGVRMNAVLPGIAESEMGGSTGALEFIRTLTINGEVRVPADLGGTFQFLASDASKPVTGAIIAADDGISAGLSPATMDAIMRGLGDVG